jgi:hypothetical protein
LAVTLTNAEMLTAAICGARRGVQGRVKGRRHRWNSQSDRAQWDDDIEGSGGELAVAKAFGMYPTGMGGDAPEPGDVGPLEVRTTPRHDGRLILHPDDDDNRLFVLVTGSMPNYVIRGWIIAGDGKQPGHWEDPTGKGRWAFFVPTRLLHPPHTLWGEPQFLSCREPQLDHHH